MAARRACRKGGDDVDDTKEPAGVRGDRRTLLYTTRIRARAVGFVYSWSRITASFAGLAIGYLLNAGGALAVAVFIAIAMVVGIVVIGVFGPVTWGIPLERINH